MSRRKLASLVTAMLLPVAWVAPAHAADAPDVPGTTAQAVCQTLAVFQVFLPAPPFASFGECVQFVIHGGAVAVPFGTLSGQIVLSVVIQNGAFVALQISNGSNCSAFADVITLTGETFSVTAGPGETNSVAIPTQFGGLNIQRFKGDIQGARVGSFGYLFESFGNFGGGGAC